MKKILNLMVIALLCAGYASGAAENSPWAAYRYALDALREMDLASDTDWTLSVDAGAPRPIKVTAGGGWNSDRQEPQIPSADGKVVYHDERSRFTVTAKPLPQTAAAFVGEDTTTQGNWQGSRPQRDLRGLNAVPMLNMQNNQKYKTIKNTLTYKSVLVF